MAWRIVVQPDGLYARFSEIVYNFTHEDMTRGEVYDLCRDYMGLVDAEHKIRRADENPSRYQESLDIILAVHGGKSQ